MIFDLKHNCNTNKKIYTMDKNQYLINHYSNFDEDSRLVSKHGFV